MGQGTGRDEEETVQRLLAKRGRVLIAEDDELAQGVMLQLLEGAADLEVVERPASTGAEALDRVREHRPDVLVVRYELGELSGIDVARQIQQERLSVALLLVVPEPAPWILVPAFAADVHGILPRRSVRADLLDAVRALVTGRCWMDEETKRCCMQALGELHREIEASRQQLADRRRPHPCLTPREHEALTLLGAGKSNPEIARELFIGVPTVKEHVSRIFTALGASSRQEAAQIAVERGLLPGQTPPTGGA